MQGKKNPKKPFLVFFLLGSHCWQPRHKWRKLHILWETVLRHCSISGELNPWPVGHIWLAEPWYLAHRVPNRSGNLTARSSLNECCHPLPAVIFPSPVQPGWGWAMPLYPYKWIGARLPFSTWLHQALPCPHQIQASAWTHWALPVWSGEKMLSSTALHKHKHVCYSLLNPSGK